MNRAQKEAYKKDYAAAKADGKPFFPYAIYKDHIVALVAIGIVILLAISVRVGIGEPINPATTDFIPRPEWYFFFLFELLKVFKNQSPLLPLIMATFIVPNILMALLFLLPFIDRGPERRIWKRPFAMATATVIIFFLAFLTWKGAHAQAGLSGDGPTLSGLDADGEAGLALFVDKSCGGCHVLKDFGVTNIGAPELTNEGTKVVAGGDRDVQWQIDHLKDPKSKTPGSAMPVIALTDAERESLAKFLVGLGTKYK